MSHSLYGLGENSRGKGESEYISLASVDSDIKPLSYHRQPSRRIYIFTTSPSPLLTSSTSVQVEVTEQRLAPTFPSRKSLYGIESQQAPWPQTTQVIQVRITLPNQRQRLVPPSHIHLQWWIPHQPHLVAPRSQASERFQHHLNLQPFPFLWLPKMEHVLTWV